MFSGFKQFVFRGNVVDLAVGVVIGGSFTAIVNAFVKDLVNPIITLIGGKPNVSLVLSIGASKFLVGDLINAIIAFLINAVVIYFFIVIPINHLITGIKPGKTPDIETKICPECLSKIPKLARRCLFCTVIVEHSKA